MGAKLVSRVKVYCPFLLNKSTISVQSTCYKLLYLLIFFAFRLSTG